LTQVVWRCRGCGWQEPTRIGERGGRDCPQCFKRMSAFVVGRETEPRPTLSADSLAFVIYQLPERD
jgi:hypothetical protein